MPAMWAKLGRRALDFSIGFFALLGFVWVPLGERTACDHVRAILSSGPAVEAGRELVSAAGRIRRQLLGTLLPAGPEATSGSESGPTGSAAPPLRSRPPTPEPPSMARADAADAGADASLPWPGT